ncbi:MAG: DUF87 domain-containing protein [Eubacterium sp.]
MKWNTNEQNNMVQSNTMMQAGLAESPAEPRSTTVYADSPGKFNFRMLQQNLQNCLSIINTEVMKNYVSSLQYCSVVPIDDSSIDELQQIQFFRITELVYQEDEFSVHKLATIFNALSNKPCTLVLMIQSDGQNNNFYLGVRSRDPQYSTGTMRQLLEQSLLGLFPGSDTADYFSENLEFDVCKLNIRCVSSVTCIADYKQDKNLVANKEFIQGLEKFILSMQGKSFTAICIANNLEHHDLVKTRKEYERIFTMMSPFANMQYNYALNSSSSKSDSDTQGNSDTDTIGKTTGINTTQTASLAETEGKNTAYTQTDTNGDSMSVGYGKNHTTGTSDGVNNSETTTKTTGTFTSTADSTSCGFKMLNIGVSQTDGVSSSVSRGKTHGTSHTDSISDSISKNLTQGINSSKSIANTIGESQSTTNTLSLANGTQYSENEGHSVSTNYAHTKALTDAFGKSQAVTLNVQNKSLINTLDRLEKQLERLDECESIGMWDFAAYFLGESAAETETAASMYRSLVSGNQSGLEIAAVNTWTERHAVTEISKYVINFLHPTFLYQFEDDTVNRQVIVDATALASTNELAIQLGLPRKSVKGLPVIEHALFAQEVLNHGDNDGEGKIELGKIIHLGRDTETPTQLDLQSLSMHTFITGSTGAGKSNTIYQMLSQLQKYKVHFLVVEPAKGEYKNVFGNDKSVSVFGTNPLRMNLLRINPFSFPKEVHIYEHLDRLVEIFNVCWPMYAAMPAILKDAIERSYVKAGWDLKKSKNKYSEKLFPNFIDVLQQIDEVMEQSQYSIDNKSDYKGALCTRIRSLTNGINSLVFTSNELSPHELFDENVIVDLSRIGSSETRALIMGLLVMKLQEHRIASYNGMNVPLNHVTVLEEAHNLLKRTSTEQTSEGSNLLGKSVEMLTNAIAEMRTYGEGFIIADQSPGLLDISVIRNTNTKIIMRLPEYSDRELVGRAAGLNDEQIIELSKLNKGVAAVYQNGWLESVLCKVHKHEYEEQIFSYEPNDIEIPDIKGELISRLIAKDIYRLIDHIDDNLICSNMPVAAKCKLFDYIQTPSAKKLDAAAAVTYELFSAEAVFFQLAKNKFDFKQQRRFIIEKLSPSIAPLPDSFIQTILYLVTYWNAQITENPSSKILLDNLIEVERKEIIIK